MKLYSQYILMFVSIITFSCVEEIDLITETEFESALVVEATITNELIQQKVLLSRSFRLEANEPSPESNANVKVIDGNSISYNFQETEPGIYLSVNTFVAQPNLDYYLEVTTSDGKLYKSTTTQLTQQTQMDDLFFERGFNENGDEGVSVFVDSFDPTGNSKFYRYTYEETYKIIAPNWVAFDLVPDAFIGCPNFELQIKNTEQQICFNTVKSNTIIIENTNIFVEDRIDDFRVRFINRNNFIMSHRYSILVNQYIQTREAHEFYSSLNELSTSDNILSNTQPGFVNGNLFSQSNTNEKVIGFFEVSSVNTQRIYFNYSDLFPDEVLPPFYISCNPFAPVFCTPGGTSPLLHSITQGFKYFEDNENAEFGEGPYSLVAAACGNCTVLGKNVMPDFWVD